MIPTGGPGGVDDAFLQVTAFGGTGPGSRLVTMNAAQWAGDYVAAGVNSIGLDLRNLGTTDLIVRLFFEDPIPGPPVNVAVSALGATLPAGGGWTHVTFDLASLTPLMGDTSTLLGDTTLVRIIHAAAAGAAEPVVGVLGIDNVLAIGRPVTVDEPPSALLVACALLVLLSLRIRRPRDFLAADRF